MSNLPAHTRTYWGRVNIPFGSNNTSQLRMESFYLWALYACLTDQATTGTAAMADPGGNPVYPGTRPSGSVWIVRGASNASSVSVTTAAGVHNGTASALWGGGTFPGDFTRGNNTTPHHWMLLENVALGYELLLNFSPTAATLTVSIAPTGTWPVGAGTTSQFPVASPTTRSIQISQTAYTTADHGASTAFTDTTATGLVRYCHFTVAPNGEFFFCKTRVGNANADSCIGVWRTVDADPSDNRNTFLFSSSSASGFTATRMSEWAWAAGLTTTNAQRTSGGNVFLASNSAGGSIQNVIASFGVDALSANYNCAPVLVYDAAPVVAYRGRYPDLYYIGTAANLSSIPSATNQIRTNLSGLVVPFVGEPLIA